MADRSPEKTGRLPLEIKALESAVRLAGSPLSSVLAPFEAMPGAPSSVRALLETDPGSFTSGTVTPVGRKPISEDRNHPSGALQQVLAVKLEAIRTESRMKQCFIIHDRRCFRIHRRDVGQRQAFSTRDGLVASVTLLCSLLLLVAARAASTPLRGRTDRQHRAKPCSSPVSKVLQWAGRIKCRPL